MDTKNLEGIAKDVEQRFDLGITDQELERVFSKGKGSHCFNEK